VVWAGTINKQEAEQRGGHQRNSHEGNSLAAPRHSIGGVLSRASPIVERCDAGSAQPCQDRQPLRDRHPLALADCYETSANRVMSGAAGADTKIAVKLSAFVMVAFLIVRELLRFGRAAGLLTHLMSSTGATCRRIGRGISRLARCGISLLIGRRVVLLSACERRGGKRDRDCEAQSFQDAHWCSPVEPTQQQRVRARRVSLISFSGFPQRI
jgi:hypothetical protein